MSARDSIRQVVPLTMRKRAATIRRRIRNAAVSLNTGEVGFRLGIKEFDAFRVAYRTGTADENVMELGFSRDTFFAAFPDYVPQPNDVIIDVGSHIGTFALLASSKVPQGRVFAIEASQETFNYLLVNIALNRADNITPVHLALADAPGVATLHHDDGSWGHSITKRLSSYSEQVAKDSLANFCTAHHIDRVGLIKFNCEGAEFPILLNTPLSVLQHFQRMLVLYHLDLVPGSNRDILVERLHQAGFVTDIRDEGTQRGWIIASAANPDAAEHPGGAYAGGRAAVDRADRLAASLQR